jgi:hypothetical protein
VEAARGTIVRSDLRSSYLSTVRSYYDLYIDLLLARGSDPASAAAAFRVSERARARALLEGLAESAAQIRKGVDPALAERERTVQAELNAKVSYRAQRAKRPARRRDRRAPDRDIEGLIEPWRPPRSRDPAKQPGVRRAQDAGPCPGIGRPGVSCRFRHGARRVPARRADEPTHGSSTPGGRCTSCRPRPRSSACARVSIRPAASALASTLRARA